MGLYYFFEFSSAIIYYIKVSPEGGSRYMSSSTWRAGHRLYYFFEFSSASLYYITDSFARGNRYMSSSTWRASLRLFYYFFEFSSSSLYFRGLLHRGEPLLVLIKFEDDDFEFSSAWFIIIIISFVWGSLYVFSLVEETDMDLFSYVVTIWGA